MEKQPLSMTLTCHCGKPKTRMSDTQYVCLRGHITPRGPVKKAGQNGGNKPPTNAA